MASDSPTWVVLAGGRGTRMGGPKVECELDGRRLIDHVVDAIPADDPVIVVGPALDLTREVRTCVEEPRFGGPVAALAAALPLIDTERFVLIAADMPWVVPQARSLLAHQSDDDVLVAVDADGRRQPMCSSWRTSSARSATVQLPAVQGASLHALMDRLTVREIPTGDAAGLVDIDTPDDLAAAHAAHERTIGDR